MSPPEGDITMIKDAKELLGEAPLWLLLGCAAVALIFWLLPDVNSRLPIAIRPYAMPASIALVVLSSFKLVSSVTNIRRVTVAKRREAAQRQRETLYGPLSALLLDLHLTTSTSTGAPRIRDRIRNAAMKFDELEHVRSKFKAAWKALGDRNESSSVEIEYGSSFPLDRVEALVRANIAHADGRLVQLLKAADRARYENPQEDRDVSREEYDLICHIFEKNRRLEKISHA